MTKYRAQRTNGYSSKREANRAKGLKILAKQGLITELQEQVAFVLAPSVVVQGRKRPPIRYVADFVYMDGGKQVVEDVKGVRTPVYCLKRHLMKSILNIDIFET